jgi:hypothetical protein
VWKKEARRKKGRVLYTSTLILRVVTGQILDFIKKRSNTLNTSKKRKDR